MDSRDEEVFPGEDEKEAESKATDEESAPADNFAEEEQDEIEVLDVEEPPPLDDDSSGGEEIGILGLEDPPPLLDDDFEDEEDEEEIERWNPVALTKAKKKLSSWAQRWGQGQDPYVEGLEAAISDGRNMTMWASLDPYERLPFPESKQGLHIGRIAEMLGFIRNVLVFVPVAITWGAIGKATEQFGLHNETIEIGEKTNFLDFWQNGYGRLDDEMLFGFLGVKIQEVAQVAFLIIAAIVLLTFASSALAVMADRRSGEDEKKAMLEREHLALILTDALEAKRSASPESIAGSIADVLNDLVDASREVRGAAAQLSGASTGVGSFNESIEQLNVRIEYLSQQVALHVSAGVVQAIGDLGETVNTLNAAVSNDTTRLMGEVMQGLDDVRTQLARTSASVEFGAEQLRDTLKDIGDGCGGPSPSRP